jgi:hypothetical protein
MSATPVERRLRARIAAHESWARTEDRTARTAKGRAAVDQKFLDQAGGDPVRAEHLRKGPLARMALTSVQARRREAKIAEAVAAEAGRAVMDVAALEAFARGDQFGDSRRRRVTLVRQAATVRRT